MRREGWNRWRVLIRRADFQKALRKIHQHFQAYTDTDRMRREFQDQWGIALWFSERLRSPATPPLSIRTVREYETFFSDLPVGGGGVAAYDPYHNNDPPFPEQADEPDQALVLRIDLSYPFMDLMNVIEKILRESISRRNRKGPGPYLPADRTRRRPDLLTKQLEVFDRYMNGDTTKQISLSLRRPWGTVRSQLKTAFQLTHTIRQHGSHRLWKRSHLSACSRCNRKRELDPDCLIVAKRFRQIQEEFEYYEEHAKTKLPRK